MYVDIHTYNTLTLIMLLTFISFVYLSSKDVDILLVIKGDHKVRSSHQNFIFVILSFFAVPVASSCCCWCCYSSLSFGLVPSETQLIVDLLSSNVVNRCCINKICAKIAQACAIR